MDKIREVIYTIIHSIYLFLTMSYQKIASVRAEADAANAKVEELEAKLKEITQEHTQQEREIVSLNNRNKQLEEELETAQEALKDLKQDDNEDVKKELENALRKISMLEQELEDSDKSLKETTSK